MAANKYNLGSVLAASIIAVACPDASADVSKRQVRKIVRQEVQRVITAPGANGLPALQGLQEPPGPQGPQGPAGPGATATSDTLRFARVLEDGTLDPAKTQGISQEEVSIMDSGDERSYCFNLIPRALGAQVTAEWGVSQEDLANSRGARVVDVGGGGCQLFMAAKIDNGGLAKPGNFFILVY